MTKTPTKTEPTTPPAAAPTGGTVPPWVRAIASLETEFLESLDRRLEWRRPLTPQLFRQLALEALRDATTVALCNAEEDLAAGRVAEPAPDPGAVKP